MSKKSKRLNKKYSAKRSGRRKKVSKSFSFMHLDRELLTLFHTHGAPLSLSELHKTLGDDWGKKMVKEKVDDLLQRGLLVNAGKKRFSLDKKGKIFSGKVEKHPRGFGFVMELKPEEAGRFFTRDPFLSIGQMKSANHGDEVLIYVPKVRRDGRAEAELLSILKRNTDRLAGYYSPGKEAVVIPEDPRYPAAIQIVEQPQEKIEKNHVVIVELLPEPSKKGFPQGRIVEILGPPHHVDVQMRMVIEKHKLPHTFSGKAIAEAESYTIDPDEIKARLDLRDIDHVTIDGATAKDFDDAICVEKIDSGHRLYVSIADVSHFVPTGSILDKEAYQRGTSIYFPGRVIPMLPEKLSNELCSLLPNEERLCFSAILDFDESGNRIGRKFSKSVIRSRRRFTYSAVSEILQGHNRELHGEEFLPMLKTSEKLAKNLHAKRMARGSIGFALPEPEMSLNDDGTIATISRKQRNFAHQIIEEFMLAANEAVASLFTEIQRDLLYRIHEDPDELKVEEFVSFATTVGLNLPKSSNEPSWFGTVLDMVRETPAEYVVNNLLLRTMQQARYSPDNCGHFGLAASDYTHFTSPIRRYPDLIVHRYLQAYLEKDLERSCPATSVLREHGTHLSSRERTAVNAERDMGDRLKVFYMEQFIGQDFPAVISGVTETCFFIELLDIFISGIVEIEHLSGDYFLFDLKRLRFVGEITGRSYQVGDEILVSLLSVDHQRKKIYFTPKEGSAVVD